MMSLVYLASALLLGLAVTRRLGVRLLAFELPALAVALGLLLWTWLSFVLALLVPYSLSLPSTIVISLAISLCLLRSRPQKHLHLPGGIRTWTVWAIFSSVSTCVLAQLMWTHDLMPSPNGLYSANATWADFGLHSSIISHFAATSRLPLDFPIAAGTHLTFPFMIDLLSAWLVHGGWSLHLALFVPGLLLTAAFLQLVLGAGVRLFGRIGGVMFGVTLLLLCGSGVGVLTAISDYYHSGVPLSNFIMHLPQDYTALTTPNAQLTNFTADALLPQRAFLMGLATFGVVIILILNLRSAPNVKRAIFTGLIIGLLPLVHAHTFIVLMALITASWVEEYYQNKHLVNQWLWGGLAALSTAAPQIAWQTFANRNGTGGHVALGWVINPGESVLGFWIHNYGLTGILIIALLCMLLVKRTLHRYLVWFVPMFILFVLANCYSLQPFAYDNVKIIYYVYLFTYIGVCYGATWVIRRSRWLLVPVSIVAIIISASGSLAVAREYQHRDQFASLDDLNLSSWVISNTRTDAVFITTDRPNQPISALAGRSIVFGYRGWLYNFHLDYQPRIDFVSRALSGHVNANNTYKAAYLAVATYEPPEWEVDTVAESSAYTKVFSNASWTVYRLPPSN